MPVFTKKHYNLVASALQSAKKVAAREARAMHGTLSNEVAAQLGVAIAQRHLMDVFAADSPKFRKLQFIEAVGPGETDATASVTRR